MKAQHVAALAAEAGQWDVAKSQTAIAAGVLRELEARRPAAPSNVVALPKRRG